MDETLQLSNNVNESVAAIWRFQSFVFSPDETFCLDLAQW